MSKKAKNDNLIQSLDIYFKYSVDALVMLVPLLLMATYLHGFNSLRVAFLCTVPAVVLQDIACRILKTNKKNADIYALASSLAIALMLPSTVPYYVPLLGGVFAVAVAIIPFGTARKLPFVPACVGFAFLCVCFKEEVFTYSAVTPMKSMPLYLHDGFTASTAFSEMLTYGKSISLNKLEAISILVGKNPGPMGTTSVLVLIGAGCYLLIKKKNRFLISLSFITACTVMALLFPRVNSGLGTSVVMELTSGSLLFTALLLLPNPATTPSKAPQTVIYGFTAGVLCMVLRYFGAFEESAPFAVLIMNALLPVAEDWSMIIYTAVKEKNKGGKPEKEKKAHPPKLSKNENKDSTKPIIEEAPEEEIKEEPEKKIAEEPEEAPATKESDKEPKESEEVPDISKSIEEIMKEIIEKSTEKGGNGDEQ